VKIVIIAAALFISAQAMAQASPPWSKGTNNPACNKGEVFQVADIDNVPDLHGNPQDAKLVLFIGGNQFFVLPRLIGSTCTTTICWCYDTRSIITSSNFLQKSDSQ
jgi:hypothetical protein